MKLSKALDLISKSFPLISPTPKKIPIKPLFDKVLSLMKEKHGEDYEIKVIKLENEFTHFNSSMYSTSKKARIIISVNDNYCLERLCVAKELIHLFLREEDTSHAHQISQSQEIFEALIMSNIYSNIVEDYTYSIDEKVGYQCALRYLFPLEYNKHVSIQWREEPHDFDSVIGSFAKLLRVPKNALEADIRHTS